MNNLNTYGNSYTVRKTSIKSYEDTNATSLSKSAKKLRDNCRALAKSDFSSGASSNIMTKIGKLIDSYNNLVKECDKNYDKTLATELEKMDKIITDNLSSLKRAGVKYEDKKLKLDSEVLKELNSPTKLTKVFAGNNEFISGMQKCANRAYNKLKTKTIEKEAPVYNKINIPDNVSACALSAGNLNSTLNSLMSGTPNISLIAQYVEKYNDLIQKSSSANDTLTDEEANYISNIKTATANNAGNLSLIGITSDADGKLSIDMDMLNNADANIISNLFGENGNYSTPVKEEVTGLFAELVDAAKAGISIDSYA